MNYLSVENLTKSFGDRVLFADLNFGIDLGQKVSMSRERLTATESAQVTRT
jgi:hypothetical protein